MNILFVQHGDYAEAHARMGLGAPETYRDQYLSVAHVERLSERAAVTILSFGDASHDTEITPSLRSIGTLWSAFGTREIAALLDGTRPDRLICRSPHRAILAEARRRRIPTLPSFADIFGGGGPRTWIRNARLRHALSGPHIPCIANHSLNASRSLVRALRLPATRIVPWDWSRIEILGAPKAGPARQGHPTLFFAGSLIAGKGVPDCIDAVALLRARGVMASISLAGTGDRPRWEGMARELGVEDAVRFLGRIGQSEVRAEMSRHDLVVVPSRHDYPEGFPNTILEGLSSQSPLILSDHPAFRGRLDPGRQCLVFEAGNARALADAVQRIDGDRGLYADLSARSEAALDGAYFGMDWTDLISRFVEDPDDRTGWVARNNLAALGG